MLRYKKRIGVIALLLIILVACGIIGQYNVRKSLFNLSEDFKTLATDQDGSKSIFINETPIEGSVLLSNSFVTLDFQYECIGINQIPEDMNLHIDIYSEDMPDNVLEWEFAPGSMEQKGTMSIDLKAFKGKNINLRFYCKGELPDNGGIKLNNIYLSKLYIGD